MPSQIPTVLSQALVDYLSSSPKPVAVPLPSASLPVHFVLIFLQFGAVESE